MTTRLNPYLSFRDNAREAMDFYESVFGGELTRSTFGEFGASDDPAEQDKVMHSMLVTDNGLTLMGADTPNSMDFTPGSNGTDLAQRRGRGRAARLLGEARRMVAMSRVPLEKAPWGDTFGMCVDKFGVSWMVNIAGAQS